MIYDVKFNTTDVQQGLYCSCIECYRDEQAKAEGKVSMYVLNNVTFEEVQAQGLTTAEEIMAYIKEQGDKKIADDPSIAQRVDMPVIEPAPTVL